MLRPGRRGDELSLAGGLVAPALLAQVQEMQRRLEPSRIERQASNLTLPSKSPSEGGSGTVPQLCAPPRRARERSRQSLWIENPDRRAHVSPCPSGPP